jgi:hypothetical protein
MTLLEYTASLEKQGIPKEKMVEMIDAWKIANAAEKVPVVDEIVTEEVAKTNGVVEVDASVTPEKVSASGDGQSVSQNNKENTITPEKQPTDPYAKFYITAEDITKSEEEAVGLLNSKLSQLGISFDEGTAFNSTDALVPSSTGDNKQGGFLSKALGAIVPGASVIGEFFSGAIPSASSIAIGEDKTPEEINVAVDAINAYIKEKGDLGFVNKARERSGKDYEAYEDYITAPVVEESDLRATMKAKLVNKFSKIKSEEIDAPSFLRKAPNGDEDVDIKTTPATIKDFDDDEEFSKYQQWVKDGFIQDFTEDEVDFFDAKRKQKFSSKKSVEYASFANPESRIDILALAAKDVEDISNFGTKADELHESKVNLNKSIDNYNNNPSQENLNVAQAEQFDYLVQQGKMQSLQAKLIATGVKDRAKTIPLALKDFNKDYDRIGQLATGFKSLATDIAYTTAQLSIMQSGPTGIAALASPVVMNAILEKEFGLISLGEDLQKEASNFQKDILVDEIRSVSDAGRWVAGATVNLIPSLAMATTGAGAMPLFFLSGSGSKGMDIAIKQKQASERMLSNRKRLDDAEESGESLGSFEQMVVEENMADDAKTLGLSNWQVLGSQALHGVAEVAFERLGTLTILKNLKNGIKQLPPLTIKDGFKIALTYSIYSLLLFALDLSVSILPFGQLIK